MRTASGVKYAGFGLLGVAAIFLFTWVVMLLWNALIPTIFKGPELSYWQTMGILVLSKILFSGIGGGAHGEKSRPLRRHRERPDYPKSRWRQKYEAKMNGVSGEDAHGEEDVQKEKKSGSENPEGV